MTACEPLCAPITGGAESLPLPADRDRIWAAVPPLWREDSPHSGFFTGDERKSGGRKKKQEKALALLWRLGGHFRPQCGRFPET